MKSIWYASKDGYQYWVSLDDRRHVYEFISDTTSPFVGGGFFFELHPASFQDADLKNKLNPLNSLPHY
jgi:hypothetical protein